MDSSLTQWHSLEITSLSADSSAKTRPMTEFMVRIAAVAHPPVPDSVVRTGYCTRTRLANDRDTKRFQAASKVAAR